MHYTHPSKYFVCTVLIATAKQSKIPIKGKTHKLIIL